MSLGLCSLWNSTWDLPRIPVPTHRQLPHASRSSPFLLPSRHPLSGTHRSFPGCGRIVPPRPLWRKRVGNHVCHRLDPALSVSSHPPPVPHLWAWRIQPSPSSGRRGASCMPAPIIGGVVLFRSQPPQTPGQRLAHTPFSDRALLSSPLYGFVPPHPDRRSVQRVAVSLYLLHSHVVVAFWFSRRLFVCSVLPKRPCLLKRLSHLYGPQPQQCAGH